MLAMNYTNLRANLKKTFDTVTNDFETVIVTRKNNENVVVMSEAEYNNIQENLIVRTNKQDYERLLKSIENAKKGEVAIRKLGRVSILGRK